MTLEQRKARKLARAKDKMNGTFVKHKQLVSIAKSLDRIADALSADDFGIGYAILQHAAALRLNGVAGLSTRKNTRKKS